MYHSHEVVQYVVTETFGDPSMSVSGAKKSRLKSGVECGGCGRVGVGWIIIGWFNMLLWRPLMSHPC